MLCNPVEIHQHFRGTHCLHLQGQRAIQARNKQEAGTIAIIFCHFLPWLGPHHEDGGSVFF
jgi:hypothetical protein